jgi:hypothetical protein
VALTADGLILYEPECGWRHEKHAVAVWKMDRAWGLKETHVGVTDEFIIHLNNNLKIHSIPHKRDAAFPSQRPPG